MSDTLSSAFADTKPHYNILDGLRGVAALTVVCFHLFEAYATSHLDQKINHGYLAVDFFFILSGFVVGYAYDDRWKTMRIADFLKRRFIRLHPMVIIGALIGAVMFYFQGCSVWDVSQVPVVALIIATLMNVLLIPATPGMDILYAFFLHKLSTKVLSILVLSAGCGLAIFALWGPLGDICVGFALTEENIIGGSLRLLFSFPAGLLLSRIFKPVKVRGAFWIGSFSIVVLSAVPRIGGSEHLWMNGLYDTICFAVVFPLLVCLGASGKTTDKVTTRVCRFLGDISYPLYMVHYPFIYLYYAWVKNENLTFIQSLPGAVALVAGSVVLAYLCLKLYDEPVRRFLSRRLRIN